MSRIAHKVAILCWLCSSCLLVAGTIEREETEQQQAVRLGNLGSGRASIQIDFSGYIDDDVTSEEVGDEEINVNSTDYETVDNDLPLEQLDLQSDNTVETVAELPDQAEVTTATFDLSTTNLDDLEIPEPERLVQKKPQQDPTKLHDVAILMRKAQIKEEIKKRLNLENLPKASMVNLFNNKKFPHHIIGGYDLMQNDQPKEENYQPTKIEQMIRFAQQVPQDKEIRIADSRQSSTMFFPMPMTVTERSLKKATLLIYLETPQGFENQIATLNITTNRVTKTRGIHLSKVGLIDGGKWHHIDVTKEARAWTRGEWISNLGLVAEATVDGTHIFQFNNSQIGQNSSIERIPIIKLDFNEGEFNEPRQKRSIDTDRPRQCKLEDNESRCCRYPFVLDFDELGAEFEFIISPKRYWANYCNGDCPEYVLPSNGHTMLMRGLPTRTKNCCSPTSLQPLTLLYLNEMGDVMKGELQGMTISQCQCV